VVTIAFTGDTHSDERSRFAEHARVMDFIVGDAQDRGCCAILHGGDVFERRSTEAERDAVSDWISLADCSMAVYLAGGNHETPGEVTELGRVHGIDAAESARVIIGEEFAVALLPWPRRASVAVWLEELTGIPPTPEAITAGAVENLRDVLREMGRQLAAAPAHLPRVLLGHVELSGAKTDPDQPAMMGSGIKLSIEDLMLAGADVVCLSHVHLPQDWTAIRSDGVTVPIIYAGSPRRTAYASGETVEKSYVVLTFEGRALTWERVPTPATDMRLLNATWSAEGTDGFWRLCFDEGFAVESGMELRLRYTCGADQREAADASARALADRWLSAGAAEVKLEFAPAPTTRARAPEVAAAPTLADKLRAVWATQGDSAPDESRAARLLARAEVIS
jgi:predicted MPP superfamily phosphohydrolase